MKPELPEDQDPAWELLKKARPVEVEARFTRGVMAAVQAEQEAKAARWGWLRAIFAPAVRPVWIGVAAAVAVTGFWLARHEPAPAPQPAVAVAPAEDALIDAVSEEIALLDEIHSLLAAEDAQSLDDEDFERVLF